MSWNHGGVEVGRVMVFLLRHVALLSLLLLALVLLKRTRVRLVWKVTTMVVLLMRTLRLWNGEWWWLLLVLMVLVSTVHLDMHRVHVILW